MLPLGEALASYLEYGRNRRYSPRTLKNRRSTLTAFVAWLGQQEVATADRLARPHLDVWIRHLNARCTPQGLPMKAQTINIHILHARGFLRHLAGLGLVSATLVPALARVKAPTLLPQGALTHVQTRRLLGRIRTTTPKGFRNRAMLELLYSSGLRASELLGLNVADVDFGQATALVTGKGNKQRVVPIGKTALRFVESYLKGVRPFMLRDPAEPALFLNRRGARLRYNAFCRLVSACADGAGLEAQHITAHTFRRSCATELLRGGANMYHVKDLLGHESLNTLKHYAKLTIVDLKKTHARCHPREKDEEARIP